MLAKNESQMDRAIRLIVGLVLLVVGSQLSGWLQIVLYILAIIALLTAATGVCFLYKLLGLDSTKMKGTAEPKAEETAKPEPEAEEVKTEEAEAEAELEVEEPAEAEEAAPEPEAAPEEVKTEEPAEAK